MEEIETLPELAEWLGEQLSLITKNDGRWAYSGYCNVINEAHEHVLFLCKQHLSLIPKRQAFSCVGEKKTATMRESTIEEFQALKNAIDPESAEGPISGNQFRYKGEVYQMEGPKAAGVLEYMWSRDNVWESDVIETVWGFNQDRHNVPNAVNKANETLVAAEYPRTLCRKDQKIFWE